MTEFNEQKQELTPEQEAQNERYWLNVNEQDASAWQSEIYEQAVRAKIWLEIENKFKHFLKYFLAFIFVISIFNLSFEHTAKPLTPTECASFSKLFLDKK